MAAGAFEAELGDGGLVQNPNLISLLLRYGLENARAINVPTRKSRCRCTSVRNLAGPSGLEVVPLGLRLLRVRAIAH